MAVSQIYRFGCDQCGLRFETYSLSAPVCPNTAKHASFPVVAGKPVALGLSPVATGVPVSSTVVHVIP